MSEGAAGLSHTSNTTGPRGCGVNEVWQTLENKSRFISQIMAGEVMARSSDHPFSLRVIIDPVISLRRSSAYSARSAWIGSTRVTRRAGR